MFKLKIKKGFTIIEVMCSLTIFSILFLSCVYMQANNLTIKKYNKEMKKYIVFIEGIKNELIYNYTYDDIQKIVFENKVFIEKENINMEKLKKKHIENMLVENKPLEKPYVFIKIEGEKILKINMELHVDLLNKERIMNCEVYKGRYL